MLVTKEPEVTGEGGGQQECCSGYGERVPPGQ